MGQGLLQVGFWVQKLLSAPDLLELLYQLLHSLVVQKSTLQLHQELKDELCNHPLSLEQIQLEFPLLAVLVSFYCQLDTGKKSHGKRGSQQRDFSGHSQTCVWGKLSCLLID